MAGTITIGGSSGGLPSGYKVIGPLTVTGSTSIGTIYDLALVTGDNTVAVPLGAVACLIVPPVGNTYDLTVTANYGDGPDPSTGLGISGNRPSVWSFRATAPTSIILNSPSDVVGNTEVSFI